MTQNCGYCYKAKLRWGDSALVDSFAVWTREAVSCFSVSLDHVPMAIWFQIMLTLLMGVDIFLLWCFLFVRFGFLF